jgi:hypothetical protein
MKTSLHQQDDAIVQLIGACSDAKSVVSGVRGLIDLRHFFGWLQLDFLCCPFFHLAHMSDPISDSSVLLREKAEYLIAAHKCIAWAPFAAVCHHLSDPELVRHGNKPTKEPRRLGCGLPWRRGSATSAGG